MGETWTPAADLIVEDRAAEERRVRARALGWLFVAGASIALISVLLPHAAGADDAGLYTNVAIAYAAGAGALLLGSRLHRPLVHAAVALATILITWAILLSGDPASFYAVWFIWVGLYAVYFFGRVAAAVHVLLIALLYAYALVHLGAPAGLGRWLTMIGALLVAAVFIHMLVRRARGQAAAAESSATTMALAAELAHRLAALGDWKEARAALCEAAVQVADAEGVALWEPGVDAATLRVNAEFGRGPDRRELRIAGSAAGVVRAFTDEAPVATTSLGDGDLAPEFLAGHSPAGARWQPIHYERRTIAVLAFYWASPEPVHSQSTITVANLLAAEAGTTLERVSLLVRLERLAQTDELTGLPNRRAWQEQLTRELERSRRTGDPLCVAMLDLDHFKRYNDIGGHLAGDRLLKEAAVAWSSQLRPTDLIARYGGEEFTVALPGCTVPQAIEVIERVRASTPEGQACSCGIARWDADETGAKLLERADKALYEAKYRGRNQIRVADNGRTGVSSS